MSVSVPLWETALRLGSFALVLALMLLWERARPLRRPEVASPRHRLNNLALVAVDALLLRLLAPAAAVAVALEAARQGWGLFHLLDWPGWLEVLAAVLLLDLAIYFQHRLFHAVPALWWLHRVHHTDVDLDTTTGVRFHPLEMLLSLGYKAAVVLLFGAPAAAVVALEVLLNACALFNHANVALPPRLEAWLSRLLVTPSVHRVHHAVPRAVHDHNFGFMLVWWDRLFGTYHPLPPGGLADARIGLESPRDRRAVDLHWLLLQPLLRRPRA